MKEFAVHIKKMTDRLEAVFILIPKAQVIADIGTDHGYLAVELVRRERAQKAIAGDVNKGPLASAQGYVNEQDFTSLVECRLGNGLQVVSADEIQGAVICGMGGFLMRQIIEEGPALLDFYVLQPQNGQAELRQYVVNAGYRICKEIIMTDMGKMYQAFLAIKKGKEALYITEEDLLNAMKNASSVYETLPKESMLWTVGALINAERPPLWEAHMKHIMHAREAALEGMTEALKETQKYKDLAKELAELEQIAYGD